MSLTTVRIESATLMRIAGIALLFWCLYVIRDIIAILLIAVIVAAALNPLIWRLQRWLRLPRGAIVPLLYLTFFALLGMTLATVVPIITKQITAFTAHIEEYLNLLQANTFIILFGIDRFLGPDLLTTIGSGISGSVGELFSRTASFFSGVVAIAAVTSMSFYLALQKDGVKRFVLLITPPHHEPYVATLVDRIQGNFGRWMAGQCTTMLFVGVLYYIALSLLGVPYALTLSLIGGLCEIVPYLGPVLSLVPAALMGLSVSPVIGFAVCVAYWIINLVENHIVIPQIMTRAVGLNPVAVIFSLLVGVKIAGFFGIILAVPVAGALLIILRDILERNGYTEDGEPLTASYV